MKHRSVSNQSLYSHLDALNQIDSVINRAATTRRKNKLKFDNSNPSKREFNFEEKQSPSRWTRHATRCSHHLFQPRKRNLCRLEGTALRLSSVLSSLSWLDWKGRVPPVHQSSSRRSHPSLNGTSTGEVNLAFASSGIDSTSSGKRIYWEGLLSSRKCLTYGFSWHLIHRKK